jgi:lipopolysaccharide/colanic/teichoic acid biosynthesis glycosyltransferase
MHESQLVQVTSHHNPTSRRTYFVCKRVMDLVLATIVLIIAAPVLVLIALLIKLDSPGPVLFTQPRLGQGGRLFIFYKFRTMRHNADPEVHRRYVQSFIRNQLPDQHSVAGSTPATFKLSLDPRISRVGHLLRRSSLDELPQLFNVIKGEMSLVGPRPPILYEVQEYQEWHKGRLAAIPGLTGLWQVRGRSRVSFDEMVRMDLEYIAQQSLWLDIRILLLTIPAVIFANGAE